VSAFLSDKQSKEDKKEWVKIMLDLMVG
jgi:hypothetical protein